MRVFGEEDEANDEQAGLLSSSQRHSFEDDSTGLANPLLHHSSTRDDHGADFVTDREDTELSRGLHQRHISLIALAGAIGTGLFLGLGSAIQTAGPAGALLSYATVGLIVCCVQFALGEVTALLPVTGSFVRHAEFLVDPALGVAVGWNIVYGTWLSIPAEISAICVLFQFWTDVNSSVWIILSIALTFSVGITFVRVYGEVEFWFALLKITLIVVLILLGLIVDLGGLPGLPFRGFEYWRHPGAFVEFISTGPWGAFLGYWSAMSSAVFSFTGTESVAMAAAETRNPRQVIPRACKRVFWRVSLFYILSVLVVGMLVASDDPHLDDRSGTAAQSPFVIAVRAAGIKALPSIVNAVVISSAWSAANQALLSGTRVLYGLALKGQAPGIMLRTTSWGIPYMCVLLQTAFMFLAFMSLSNGALTVFFWFLRFNACGVLVSWITVLYNHVRLLRAMRIQGLSYERLPWHNAWTRWTSPVALAACVLIMFTSGFAVFTEGNWDGSKFTASYADILLVLIGFTGWKIFKKTRMVDLAKIPIKEALDEIERNPEEDDPPAKGWRKVAGFLWD